MTEFNRYEIDYDTQSFICEWDFEGIKRACSMGIMEQTSDSISLVKTAFFCSLLKHHPFANKRIADEFVDKVIQDEEYGLDYFSPIVDDFLQGYTRLQGGKSKKKKILTPVNAPVVNIPKKN